MGCSVMRNAAIFKAKGKYMKFLDDDDASIDLDRLHALIEKK
jgi:hypothetical protein